jgi:hypothetical protein
MNRRLFVAILLSASFTQAASAADCFRFLSFNAADNTAAIAYSDCSDMPAAVDVGDAAAVTIGTSRMDAKVTKFFPPNPLFNAGAIIQLTALVLPGARNVTPGDAPEYSGDAASVTLITNISGTSKTFTFPVTLANPVNHQEHKGSVGPVSGTTGDAATNATPSAMRFQYTGAYVRFPSSSPKLRYWQRGFQQEFTVSIDTTNQKGASFTDDNRASLAAYLPRASFGSLLNRARIGVQGQYSKALHTGVHDFDTTLVAEGWLPMFQAVTLFSKSSYLAPPLNVSLSWGQRNRNVNGAKSDGTLVTGLIGYHLYLLDHYRVDLEQKTTVNSAANVTSKSPRTTRNFKASVLYSANITSRFVAVASFENGHSGPVFTKLRQYFVGVGLQNLFDQK